MRLPKFDYLAPASLDEALKILAEEPGAKILAGGTDLLVNMKHRVERPAVVVNLKGIAGLSGVRAENGDIRIGALTPLRTLGSDPLISAGLPALARAASRVGSYHHQVMGTIGGNVCQQTRCKYYNQSSWWRSSRPLCFKAGGEVCHVVGKDRVCYSHYCGDAAPALMALGAQAEIAGLEASRRLKLDELFSGAGQAPLTLAPGEVLSAIIIPAEASPGTSTYRKFANRESIDFPIVGVALWVSPGRDKARVALTAVDRRPVRAEAAEAFIAENGLGEDGLDELAGLVSKAGRPTASSLYAPSFKRNMIGRLVKAAVQDIWET